MLKTRVITALVLLAVFVPVTLFAPITAFAELIALVIMFAAWEWARLLKVGTVGAIAYALVAVLLTGASAMQPDLSLGQTRLFQAVSVFWVITGPYVLLRKPTLSAGMLRVLMLLAGMLVFFACWNALVAARIKGAPFVLSLLLVVWIADIGAYFAGRMLGRHKLAPAISPGKTWEGVIGGWAAVLVCAAIIAPLHTFSPTLFSMLFARAGVVGALLLLTVLVAFSVMGDLFESMLKRQADVKDSSNLLPGHGGVLDRIDALLPVLPLAMLMLHG